MALHTCPYMTAGCPHYKQACTDPESKDCLYVQNTTANLASTFAVLSMPGAEKLPQEMTQKMKAKIQTFMLQE